MVAMWPNMEKHTHVGKCFFSLFLIILKNFITDLFHKEWMLSLCGRHKILPDTFIFFIFIFCFSLSIQHSHGDKTHKTVKVFPLHYLVVIHQWHGSNDEKQQEMLFPKQRKVFAHICGTCFIMVVLVYHYVCQSIMWNHWEKGRQCCCLKFYQQNVVVGLD